MGSKILPQALAVIPRNPTQFHVPKKLGFSSTINRSSYLSNSASSSRFSVSRVSSTSLSSNHEAFFKEFARQSFVTRAESESGGGEVVEETENVEEEVVVEGSEEEEVQAEVEGAVKEPRKPRVKLGDIIGILNKRAVEASEMERPIPDIRTGDIVEIKLEVPENRRRLSIYKGIVISKQNAGIHTTIRIRRIIAGIGVEIVFPLFVLPGHGITECALIYIFAPLIVELEKQSFCDLKVVNNTEHHVAFKVKTTSPKKYFVRPNTGVIQPWDSFVIKVTLQAQREYPLDMQCKDKFLLQSTIVLPPANVDELPPDTFNKDSDGKVIQEMKLRVVYMPTSTTQGNLEDEVLLKGSEKIPDANSAVQLLEDERDAAVRQTQLLQQELDLLRRRRYRKTDPGFSLMFAFVVGLVGIMIGFLLNLSLSSPSTE
ncbi:hypothetical protein NC652_001648 [Populus alba x Populus x berolinensis]|nr:hypothetical protein NC652_001648 [Populus alba x Populus x berolinensis]